MLMRLGFEVVAAADAPEALAAWDGAAFDLAVVDRELPSMDGATLTGELRRRERAATGRERPARIVGVTATSTDTEAAAWRAAGADELLRKPVERAALERLAAL